MKNRYTTEEMTAMLADAGIRSEVAEACDGSLIIRLSSLEVGIIIPDAYHESVCDPVSQPGFAQEIALSNALANVWYGKLRQRSEWLPTFTLCGVEEATHAILTIAGDIDVMRLLDDGCEIYAQSHGAHCFVLKLAELEKGLFDNPIPLWAAQEKVTTTLEAAMAPFAEQLRQNFRKAMIDAWRKDYYPTLRYTYQLTESDRGIWLEGELEPADAHERKFYPFTTVGLQSFMMDCDDLVMKKRFFMAIQTIKLRHKCE